MQWVWRAFKKFSLPEGDYKKKCIKWGGEVHKHKEILSDEVATVSDDFEEVARFAKIMGVEATDVFSAKKNLETNRRKDLALYILRSNCLTDIVSLIHELPFDQLLEIKRIIRNVILHHEIIEKQKK